MEVDASQILNMHAHAGLSTMTATITTSPWRPTWWNLSNDVKWP